MRLSTTTDVLQKRLGFKKAIDILAEAGYDCIDFSQFNEDIYKADLDRAYFEEIRKYAQSKGLTFNQSTPRSVLPIPTPRKPQNALMKLLRQ